MIHQAPKWDVRFLALARHVSGWSRDPSTKVGAVIVNDRRVVVALGYNGFPRGVKDLQERYDDRPTKYAMTQHAEANAVLNASAPVHGATLYCTHPCCAQCTGLLIQAGIKRIVTASPDAGLRERFADSFRVATQMAKEAKVEVIEVEGI